MTQYAKEVDNVLQHPTPEEFRGVPNYMTHDVLLRRHGYMPVHKETHRTQDTGYISIHSIIKE